MLKFLSLVAWDLQMFLNLVFTTVLGYDAVQVKIFFSIFNSLIVNAKCGVVLKE